MLFLSRLQYKYSSPLLKYASEIAQHSTGFGGYFSELDSRVPSSESVGFQLDKISNLAVPSDRV